MKKKFRAIILILVLLSLSFIGFRIYKRLTGGQPTGGYVQDKAQNAPSGKYSPYADLNFSKDYFPGTMDKNGLYMGGSETIRLVSHAGKIYAGMGFWEDMQGNEKPGDLSQGAQVLVKESATSPWRVEKNFGSEYLRTDALHSITFTTDKNGNQLNPPVTMLLAGVSNEVVPQATVWSKDEKTGEWIRSIVTTVNTKNLEKSYVRLLFDHVDKITGVHAVFAGVTESSLYRGVYDADVPGKILWDKAPELTGSKRMMSSVEADEVQYIAVNASGSADDLDGGLFKRIDGEAPRWEFIYEWEPDKILGKVALRGLTAVKDPHNMNKSFLLGATEAGVIEKIDPANGHQVTGELDFRSYFEKKWGSLGGVASLAAYNDMIPVLDPKTGETHHLIGVWLVHPQSLKQPTNGAWYLVRFQDGTYTDGYIYDDTNPVPEGKSLRATRTIIASPFPEEAGRVFYFGGYDAGGKKTDKHDAAWIYKGSLK